MAVPFCATTYLDRDQAGQVEMPLHHDKAAQEVFTLGAKVWKFPGQKYHPGKEGNKRNKELKVTLEQEKSSSVGVCLRANPLTHLRAPSGSAWFPPPPTRWGAASDDRSTGLLSQSTTTSPSGQREAVHLWLSLPGSFMFWIFFFPFSQWRYNAGSLTRPTYPQSSRTRCARQCAGPPSCHLPGAVTPLSGCSAVG